MCVGGVCRGGAARCGGRMRVRLSASAGLTGGVGGLFALDTVDSGTAADCHLPAGAERECDRAVSRSVNAWILVLNPRGSVERVVIRFDGELILVIRSALCGDPSAPRVLMRRPPWSHRQQSLSLVKLLVAVPAMHHIEHPLVGAVERKPVVTFPNRLPRAESAGRSRHGEPVRNRHASLPGSADDRQSAAPAPTSDGIAGSTSTHNSSEITPERVMSDDRRCQHPNYWDICLVLQL